MNLLAKLRSLALKRELDRALAEHQAPPPVGLGAQAPMITDVVRIAAMLPKEVVPQGQWPDQLEFANLMPAMAKVLNIPSDGLTAFSSRIKNLQRIGVPPGLESRRGKRTLYTSEQATELCLAVELNLGGLTPEYIKALIEDKRDAIHRTAEAGLTLVFRPVSALASLTGNPCHKARGIFIWQVGRIRGGLIAALSETGKCASERRRR